MIEVPWEFEQEFDPSIWRPMSRIRFLVILEVPLLRLKLRLDLFTAPFKLIHFILLIPLRILEREVAFRGVEWIILGGEAAGSVLQEFGIFYPLPHPILDPNLAHLLVQNLMARTLAGRVDGPIEMNIRWAVN